ncbi:bifunctional transcriptional activator/DNA repair enzyme AdaA [Lentibacillus sp. N15]|uniref:bifunctional transcriptional activator/DNA repair enzyme AdaA n=1 Tax=Lentibacillus songyuanensis TaxID=3136161 RepID=UPI0031B9F8EA
MGEKKSINSNIWQAIIQNDASFDGFFFYGVKTTGIFCRPSCKSRVPNQENVQIFRDVEQALSQHFRPCKRCRPDGLRMPDEEWVIQITEWIDTHYSETLTLDTIAEMFHGSPYHLHRIFKRIKGISLAGYIQQTRISKAKQSLFFTDQSIKEIAEAVGIPNAAHFTTLFQKKTGLTPTVFRKKVQTEKNYGGVQDETK